ncbi:MAG: hypothetical protein M3364_03360 [Actinomycetota bacterium]|nr:hypothetical protein [Actinomycetota bacterium]
MTRYSLRVVEGTAAPSLRRHPVTTPRIRPGEYPVWCELSLAKHEQALLRRRAHERGVGTDAFVGASLEYLLLADVVGDELVTALLAAATREVEHPAIGSAPELRGWQRLLEGLGEPPADELPSICIAMRLLSQLPVSSRAQRLEAAAVIGDAQADAALLFETVASRRGLTMSFWALRQLAAWES